METIKVNIANILTFFNTSIGVLAIFLTIRFDLYIISCILIIISSIIDRYDGKIARRNKIESEFGKQIDTLNDLICFGVAPMILYIHLVFEQYIIITYIGVVIYIFASIYRLARFNISKDKIITITGLPITVAGAIFSGFIIVYDFFMIDFKIGLFIIIIALSLLMISKHKMKRI